MGGQSLFEPFASAMIEAPPIGAEIRRIHPMLLRQPPGESRMIQIEDNQSGHSLKLDSTFSLRWSQRQTP
ncbi:hypothetical protein MUK42_34609 [Musa troglodytarum]|uniref:Uncharacterized protein n=1 Tax=Musa troglodytarum TaxID=320322 RepID=A0A9E7JB01_9LILI|nr:hypothetical protein MUK42_34609 [Musa troglodytarum]